MSSTVSPATMTEHAAPGLAELLLSSTGEGIYGVDMDGNCTFANPACVRLLGFESDQELLGCQMHDLVHHTRPGGDRYPVEECRIYLAFRRCEGVHVDDEVMFRRDGTSFPVEYWSYPVRRDGELVGCVLTFVDITARRQAEEELRQAEKAAALNKLSAGVAHELNNPAAAASRAAAQLARGLGELQATTVDLVRVGIPPDMIESLAGWAAEVRDPSVSGSPMSALEASDAEEGVIDWLDEQGVEDGWALASALVSAGLGPADLDALVIAMPTNPVAIEWLGRALAVQDLAGSVVEASQDISVMVNLVKSYSHMDQAPVQRVDVAKDLDATVALMRHRQPASIEIIRDYDADLPPVETRGSELNQVWTSLLDNAIDAVGDAGTIRLRTSMHDGSVMIEICDDGVGIQPEIQSCVFDPFFTTKDVGQGVGLGLDVARRIVVDRLGGRIDVESRPGDTRFTVQLPLA